jgi:prevent-host-death family protein
MPAESRSVLTQVLRCDFASRIRRGSTCAIICHVAEEVGLREMRQNASELVRRAEAGERLTVTVAGRPAAVLGPVAPRRWRQWDEIADLFRTPVDSKLAADLDWLDAQPDDPWA